MRKSTLSQILQPIIIYTRSEIRQLCVTLILIYSNAVFLTKIYAQTQINAAKFIYIDSKLGKTVCAQPVLDSG